MKEKILQYLKTKIGSHAGGVQEAFLIGVAEKFSKTITEEDKIPTEISESILETLKTTYDFMQSEVGRRTTVAQETALKNWREKHGIDENGKPISKKKPDEGGGQNNNGGGDDIPEWFKQIQKATQTETAELRSKIEKYETEKTREQILGKVHSALKEKGIPLSFLGKVASRNLMVESDDKIDPLITEIEADWNAFSQEAANNGVNVVIPKGGSGSPPDGEAKGKEIAARKNASATEGVKAKKL